MSNTNAKDEEGESRKAHPFNLSFLPPPPPHPLSASLLADGIITATSGPRAIAFAMPNRGITARN